MRDLTRPTETTTYFFRGRNLSTFTDTVMPLIFGEHEGSVDLVQLGPSTGEETWTIASAFAVNGLRVAIRAFDANPKALAKARRAKYPNVTLTDLYEEARYSDFSQDCADHFLQTGGRLMGPQVRPKPKLVATASFQHRNVQTDPLPADSCDALIANNILRHYDCPERDDLFEGMVQAVREGGLISFEGDGILDKWTSSLPDRFPVKPMIEAGFWAPNNLRVIGKN